MKDLLKITITATCILALVLSAVTANAGPRGGVTGKRDVIADATAICVAPPEGLQSTCDLLYDTNGGQDTTSRGCDAAFDEQDSGIVTYSLRNCDNNEEALLRKASSAVLSLDDYLSREKERQVETAAGYLCEYANKYMILEGAGKLTSTEDLAADAEDIADDLSYPCD